MDEFECVIMACGNIMIIFLFGLIMFTCGFAAGEPTELEKQKGCIVYNDKIYCEVNNIEKGE